MDIKEYVFPLSYLYPNMSSNNHWSNWLKSWDLNYFITITTKNKLSISRARRLAMKILYKGGFNQFFWVAEPHHENGYHIHALIDKCPSEEFKRRMEKYTAGGRTQVEEIKSKSDVADYITKTLLRYDVDYDFEANFLHNKKNIER